jgi:hypothetical protein
MALRITLVAAAVVVLLGAFVWWRYTSVARGAATRDEALLSVLDPVATQLDAGGPVSAETIAHLAARPELRVMLHALLSHYTRLDLFPTAYLNRSSEAESAFAYWALHPNELKAVPASIQPVATLARSLGSRSAQFVVLRYQMPPDHWAGTDWQLGLAGPFFSEDPPYPATAGAFSRSGDRAGAISPDALVDWYVSILNQKFGGGV